jgi:hypothetical protein
MAVLSEGTHEVGFSIAVLLVLSFSRILNFAL